MFASGPPSPGALPPEVAAPTSARASSAYDALGRIVARTDFRGNTSTWTYHDATLSVEIKDAEQQPDGTHQGSLTTLIYDGHHRMKSTDVHLAHGPQNASGDLVTSTDYLATGEPTTIKQTFPGGTSTRSFSYDSLGRLVQSQEPNVGTWTYARDAEGRIVGTSDGRGCGENIYYDLLGRVVAKDYSPCTWSQPPYSPIVLDGTGAATSGAEVSFSYDQTTGLIKTVSDRARADQYDYDSAGHLSRITRKLALPVRRLPGAIRYGQPLYKYFDQYNLSGQLTQSRTGNKLAAANSPQETEVTTYTYDDRIAEITTSPAGVILQSQTYNADGTVHTQTFGDAARTQASFGYDNNGALSAYQLGRSAGPWVSGYAAPPPGDFSLIGDLTDLQIGRDKVGNTLTVLDTTQASWISGTKPMSPTYTYFDDYRLSSVTQSSGDGYLNPFQWEQSVGSTLYWQAALPATGARLQRQSFNYDWRGNITNSSDDAKDFVERSLGTVTITPGTDQPSKATSSDGSQTLVSQFDAAGNLTDLVRNTGATQTMRYSYAWDEVGNLLSASRYDSNGGVSETFSYAADGKRVRTTRIYHAIVTHTVTAFESLTLKDTTLAGSDTDGSFCNSAGNGSCDYVDVATTEQLYLAGGLAHVFSNAHNGIMPGVVNNKYVDNTVHTFLRLADARGSSAFVIDQDSGELVERTSYQAYGALDSDGRPGRWQGAREDLQFSGNWDNTEIGLVYFGARYYSPQLARFISADPLTIQLLKSDPNPYAYVRGQPIDRVDPQGLQPVVCDQPESGDSTPDAPPAPPQKPTPPPQDNPAGDPGLALPPEEVTVRAERLPVDPPDLVGPWPAPPGATFADYTSPLYKSLWSDYLGGSGQEAYRQVPIFIIAPPTLEARNFNGFKKAAQHVARGTSTEIAMRQAFDTPSALGNVDFWLSGTLSRDELGELHFSGKITADADLFDFDPKPYGMRDGDSILYVKENITRAINVTTSSFAEPFFVQITGSIDASFGRIPQ
jgi:RHS repeat-associated protein